MLIVLAVFASFAFAGGGGGLDHSNPISQKIKATCTSGTTNVSFVDVVYRSWDGDAGEEEDFVSTNIVIETNGQVARYFNWYGSLLNSIRTSRALEMQKVSLMDHKYNEAYFDIAIDFKSGSGALAAARYAGKVHEFYPPFLTLNLNNCVLK